MSAITPYYTSNYKNNDEPMHSEEDSSMESDNVLLGSAFNPISDLSTFSTADAKAKASFRKQMDEESMQYRHMDLSQLHELRNKAVCGLNEFFKPTSNLSIFSTADEKANASFRKQLDEESMQYKHMDRSELRELRNKAVSDLNENFKRVYANVGLDDESVKQTPKILKEKRADREVAFKCHIKDLFLRGSGNVENAFYMLSNDDQCTVLNWIDRFKLPCTYFLVDLLSFITANPDKMETCKSFLDVQDPKIGVEDRMNSMGNYMNMFSCNRSEIRGGAYML